MLLKIIKVEKLESTRVLLPVKFNIRNSTTERGKKIELKRLLLFKKSK